MKLTRAALSTAALVLIAAACGADVNDDSMEPRVAVAISTEGCTRPQQGTGVVIEGEMVLTAAHVLAGATDVEVTSWRGETFEALPVLIDPDLDFAVLRVTGLNVAPAPIADGEIGVIAAVAVPRGGTRLMGASLLRVVSARTTDIYRSHKVVKLALEVELDAQSGDSGAPILNSSSEVVGILISTSVALGSSFALHVDEFRDLLDEVPQNRAARGFCSR